MTSTRVVAVPTTVVSDSRLWLRGDEAAFGELFERHIEVVWKYCYRLTASAALAEGLAAETFYIAWRSPTAPPRTPLSMAAFSWR